MMDPTHPRHPVLDDVMEAVRRLERAEHAREAALRAWESSTEPYPLNAAVALEAAERDMRLARVHLESVQRALVGAKPQGPVPAVPVAAATAEADEEWEKSWGCH